jgi:nitrite reductase/ring-hydroxylating ferredoxin subunit
MRVFDEVIVSKMSGKNLRSIAAYRQPHRSSTMAEYVTVARANAMPPGMATVVIVNGQAIALFNVQGTFYALDNRCPHQDYPLGRSPVFDNLVLCIGHAWRFNIKTGECYSVPGVSVRTYEVITVGNEVKIRVDTASDEGTLPP